MANPFDGPSIDINSDEFFKMVTQVMINKHNDEEDDFNLND
jgi:hypothetical protein